MNFEKLTNSTNEALKELERFTQSNGADSSMISIMEQLKFISGHASKSQDPRKFLNGKTFTYAIIASREFSSPEEMKIKMLLNKVSSALDE